MASLMAPPENHAWEVGHKIPRCTHSHAALMEEWDLSSGHGRQLMVWRRVLVCWCVGVWCVGLWCVGVCVICRVNTLRLSERWNPLSVFYLLYHLRCWLSDHRVALINIGIIHIESCLRLTWFIRPLWCHAKQMDEQTDDWICVAVDLLSRCEG